MKASINEAKDEIKNELKAKLAYWNKLKSNKVKAGVILACAAVIALKIFTSILTFDWLSRLFQ